MALLFAESFENIRAASGGELFSSVHSHWTHRGGGGGEPYVIDTDAARYGSKYAVFSGIGPVRSYVALGAAYGTLYTGFGLWLNASPFHSTGNHIRVCGFYDGSTEQFFLAIDSLAGLAAFRGDDTELGRSVGGLIYNYTWHFVEVRGTISNSAGVITVNLDGDQVLNLTGLDNQVTANAQADNIEFGARFVPTGGEIRIDGVYINSTGSSVNNGFSGDSIVAGLFPNADGSVTQFTRVGSTANAYVNVDETTGPNDATDYNESGTTGQRDLYNITNQSTAIDSIYGVSITQRMLRSSTTDTDNIRLITRDGTTESQSTDLTISTTGWQFYTESFNIRPAGGAWAPSDITSVQIGSLITT